MAEIGSIHEAKTHLSRLIERVAAGEQVTIARAGKPVADLVPHRVPPIAFGTLRGKFDYNDDVFDEPDERLIDVFEEA